MQTSCPIRSGSLSMSVPPGFKLFNAVARKLLVCPFADEAVEMITS